MGLSLAFQDFDARRQMKVVEFILHVLLLPVVLPFVSLLESITIVSIFVWPVEQWFHVVKK